jgi:hypothetical protein
MGITNSGSVGRGKPVVVQAGKQPVMKVVSRAVTSACRKPEMHARFEPSVADNCTKFIHN